MVDTVTGATTSLTAGEWQIIRAMAALVLARGSGLQV